MSCGSVVIAKEDGVAVYCMHDGRLRVVPLVTRETKVVCTVFGDVYSKAASVSAACVVPDECVHGFFDGVWLVLGDAEGHVMMLDKRGGQLWRGRLPSGRGGVAQRVTSVVAVRDSCGAPMIIASGSAGSLVACTVFHAMDEFVWRASTTVLDDADADLDDEDEEEDENGVRCCCVARCAEEASSSTPTPPSSSSGVDANATAAAVTSEYIFTSFDQAVTSGTSANIAVYTTMGDMVATLDVGDGRGRKAVALCAGIFSDSARKIGCDDVVAGCDDGSIVLLRRMVPGNGQKAGASNDIAREYCDIGVQITRLVALRAGNGKPGVDGLACAGHFSGIAIVHGGICTCFVDMSAWVVGVDAWRRDDNDVHEILLVTADGEYTSTLVRNGELVESEKEDVVMQ